MIYAGLMIGRMSGWLEAQDSPMFDKSMLHIIDALCDPTGALVDDPRSEYDSPVDASIQQQWQERKPI